MLLIRVFYELNIIIKILMIAIATICLIIGIIGLCILECDIGYYECSICHERFVPTLKSFILVSHNNKENENLKNSRLLKGY